MTNHLRSRGVFQDKMSRDELHIINDADKGMKPTGSGPEMTAVATGSDEDLAACSLVLSAVAIDHITNKNTLQVEQRNVSSALYHLNQYLEENKNWPPAQYNDHVVHTDNPPTVFMMSLFILFFWYTGEWSNGNSWFINGAVNNTAILEQDQWWRLVTALTLHADLIHLVGNCIIGGFMVHLLCKATGYGLGWFLLLLVGGSGNFLNIILRDQPHLSVGFSTAIFGAVGIFSGLRLHGFTRAPLQHLIIPLGGGVGLLAFLGTSGARTDLGAHLLGFCAGIGAGILVRKSGLIKDAQSQGLQQLLFGLTLCIVFFCWSLALSGTEALR